MSYSCDVLTCTHGMYLQPQDCPICSWIGKSDSWLDDTPYKHTEAVEKRLLASPMGDVVRKHGM